MSSRAKGGRRPPLRSESGGGGKRDVAGPSSVSDVILGLGLSLSRRYLFVSAARRAVAYAVAVVVGSLLGEFVVPSASGRLPWWASKSTLLNRWGVKLGWAWTFSATTSFAVLAALVYSAGDWRLVRRQAARLFVATGVWYFATWAFLGVERRTGLCTVELGEGVEADRWSCPKGGGKWLAGFDISGHAFLLIYACLIMTEEARVFKGWDALRRLLASEEAEPVHMAGLSRERRLEARRLYSDLDSPVRLLFFAMAALALAWDVALVITVVWHHTMAHKVAGASVALLAWQLTYRLWFTYPASPGLPGQTAPVRYQAFQRAERDLASSSST